jgi:thiamine-monophosphate kinase
MKEPLREQFGRKMQSERQDEDSLVRRIAAKFRLSASARAGNVTLGIGDDAALWKATPGLETILTCDWFLEDLHFLKGLHPADSVGWKCLARAVSDIAAMGGVPRCFLLSLALPETHTGRWLDEFLDGLRAASRKLKCVLAGGDTTRHEKILINVTVIGEIETKRAALRSGARKGDWICVSGQLGGAQAGLELLLQQKGARKGDVGLDKHLYPVPRVELGRRLVKERLVTAMMDLSDGLSTDLKRLCEASGVGARIEEWRLPLAKAFPGFKGGVAERIRAALHGGDDYELLFTVPKSKARHLKREIAGAPVTIIGEIQSGRRILLLKQNGREQSLESGGWDPFRHVKRRF